MGFNKRYLTIDKIKGVYERSGLEGVEKFIQADGLMFQTEKELMVISVFKEYTDDEMRKIKLEEILYE